LFLFWDGLESIPELTDNVDGLSRLAARTGVQSSLLFSRSKCSRYVLWSSDTDPPYKTKRFIGASCHANGASTPFTTRV
jgi:hypothetical protein